MPEEIKSSTEWVTLESPAIDPEIDALAKAFDIFKEFPPTARGRMIEWLVARLDADDCKTINANKSPEI